MRFTKLDLLKETIRWQVARLLRVGYTKQRITVAIFGLIDEILK